MESASHNTFNALIIGDYATGKSYGMRHARGPVLIHSFDPGGSKALKDEVASGRVIIDSRFENEDPANPTAFRLWEQEVRKLYKEGIFNQIGTYVIDSLTMMGAALQNQILKDNGRAPSAVRANFGKDAAIPQIRDYQIEILTLKQELQFCASLPCDFICLGHVKYDKDEETGKMTAAPMITGKGAHHIPILFDEVYVTMNRQGEYVYLTQPQGYDRGRTRIGAGVFDKFEPQNIKAMLAKAGLDANDKPLFTK